MGQTGESQAVGNDIRALTKGQNHSPRKEGYKGAKRMAGNQENKGDSFEHSDCFFLS